MKLKQANISLGERLTEKIGDKGSVKPTVKIMVERAVAIYVLSSK